MSQKISPKKVILLVLITFTTTALIYCIYTFIRAVEPAPPPSKYLYNNYFVSYHFASETAYEDISVSNSILSYTYFPDLKHKCKFWVAQVPCWKDPDLVTVKTPLSQTDSSSINRQISTSGFLGLNATYNIPKDQRAYSYTIKVLKTDTFSPTPYNYSQEVTYYSYPFASPMPSAFKSTQFFLQNLAKIKFPSEYIDLK